MLCGKSCELEALMAEVSNENAMCVTAKIILALVQTPSPVGRDMFDAPTLQQALLNGITSAITVVKCYSLSVCCVAWHGRSHGSTILGRRSKNVSAPLLLRYADEIQKSL